MALGLECFLSRDHFVDHHAERENIGARIGLAAFELFRGHVLEGAQDRPLRR